jgi:DNA-binding beta-propeller fold protein YncE
VQPARRKPLLDNYGARPRRAVFAREASQRRRRMRLLRTVSVLLLIIAAVAGYFWLWSRPVAVAVISTPNDALLTFSDGRTAAGALKLGDVKPGSYKVSAARAGFATKTVEFTAKHFRGAKLALSLAPMPQKLTVSATPDSAKITVSAAGKVVASGVGKVECEVPAGSVQLSLSDKGRNPFTRTWTIDHNTTMQVMLDPEGQLVHSIATIPCKGAPKGIVVTPDGKEAWATILNGPPSIEIFEPRSGKKIGGIDIGKFGAVEIVFTKDAKLAYVSQMQTAKVFEIDVKTRKVLRDLPTNSSWTKVVALSPDEKTLYAANWSGDDISEIDLESGKVRRRTRVADTPRGLWPSKDGKTLWIASFGEGIIERQDLETGKVTEVFKGGKAMRHMVADEKRQMLFTSDMGKDCVWVTEMKTGDTKKFADVGHKPNTIDLSPDGRVLFVSNRGKNGDNYNVPGPEWGSILMLDSRTAEPIDGIVGGNQCTALDVSDDGKLLLFSDFLDYRLRVFEIPSWSVLKKGAPGRAGSLAKEVVK